MSRKHTPLLIGGALALLLAIIFLYLLFSAKGTYSDRSAKLDQVEGRLIRLSSRTVFPSESNVRTLSKQLSIYQEYLDGLYGAMSEGQFKAVTVPRDRFQYVLEEVLRRLVNKARAKEVTLPPDFSFGFERYTAGNLPAADEVERLGIQLRSIAALCEVLYEAGIGELTSVERTVFEKDAQLAAPLEGRAGRRGGRRNRAEKVEEKSSTEVYTDPDGLFTKEHYVLKYRAQDDANWAILDSLAKGSPFVVVTKLEILNSARPVVALPKEEKKEEKASNRPVSSTGWKAASPRGVGAVEIKTEEEILPRELRVVAGQEFPNVHLEVDLYRFAQADSVEDAGESGEENP